MKIIFTKIVLCLSTIIFAISVNAQEQTPSSITPTREYRVIRTEKLDTFEKELAELGEKGYRIEHLLECATVTLQAAIVSRPVDENQRKQYEYKLLKDSNVKDLQKLVDEAAQNGFEVRGVISATIPYLQGQIGLIVERLQGESSATFQYSIIQSITADEKKFHQQFNKVVSDQYQPIKLTLHLDMGPRLLLFKGGPSVIIVLSKPVSVSDQTIGDLEYKIIDAQRISTMEKELNAAAKEGYRYALSALAGVIGITRIKGQIQQQYEYKLHELKEKKRDQDLAQYTQEGYDFRATFVGAGGVTSILERKVSSQPQSLKREYKFIRLPQGYGEKTVFDIDFSKAISEGFHFIDFSGNQRKTWVVLGR